MAELEIKNLHVSVEEKNSEDIKRLKSKFMESLERKLGERAQGIVTRESDDSFERDLDQEGTPYFEPYDDDEDRTVDADDPIVSEEDDPVGHDKYVSAKVQIQRADTIQRGVVKARKRDHEG